jgi:NAD(P)-dependent dehydrogenase (short-subunit alcohol dehydrogenase family)
VTLLSDEFALQRLDGKVLVVTGGTQGLGAATARRAARLAAAGIVNIITMASHGGEPALTAYSASKGALATLTRNAGYQLQPDRIRVNGLNIGWTATDAPMVTYLLSDAAAMITGSVIDFDQTVHGPYGEHVPGTTMAVGA